MWKEFKAFAMKGNVLDLAVAVVIGGAFGKIVGSLVEDIIMPFVGLLLGGLDFSGLRWIIAPATDAAAEVALRYGAFLQAILDFLIIAFSIFLVVKMFNMRKKKEAEAVPPAPGPEEILLTEIRDLLKEKS